MNNILFLFALTFSLSALAGLKLKVIKSVSSSDFALAIGSEVEFSDSEKQQTLPAVFLGRMPSHPHFGEEILLLNKKSGKVMMVDGKGRETSISRSRMQPLVSTIDQAGETCAAYAIYHFWLQLNEMGRMGNGELNKAVALEKGRMKLLEESIISYYFSRTFRLHNSLKKFGERFGFNCKERIFQDTDKARSFIFENARNAIPVIIEFNIGAEMVTTANPLIDYETNEKPDPRLWIPRKRGEKNVAGHVVVAAGAFTDKAKNKVMILDSNWNEPRIWDLNDYITLKTAIKEMVFHKCE